MNGNNKILFVIVQLFYFYFFPHARLVLYVCTINSHELCYFDNYLIGGKNSIMFFQEKMHWYNWYWNEVNYYSHYSVTSLSASHSHHLHIKCLKTLASFTCYLMWHTRPFYFGCRVCSSSASASKLLDFWLFICESNILKVLMVL